jgi:predicted nucleotide-binding protein (sugar kinase/HSP70/actin superfamily)
MACLPLKLTIGNLIEGLEAGADTTIMVGGYGPCRFGYYADLQRRIIENLGYEFDAVIIEPPALGLRQFARTLKGLAPHMSYAAIWRNIKVSFRKAQAYDRVDQRANAVRCFEVRKGDTTAARERALEIVRGSHTLEEIRQAEARALSRVSAVEQDPTRDVLKVGFVGEFYLVLEPFTNFDMEEYLGDRHVFVERGTYLTDWIAFNERNEVRGIPEHEVEDAAHPYLTHRVGGDGQVAVGHTVLYKDEGYDGVIHLMPFTCMPEIIAKSILPIVSREEEIPYISFVVDEQTGRAGVHTRLEAFLDLLWSRRRQAQTTGPGLTVASAPTPDDEREPTSDKVPVAL